MTNEQIVRQIYKVADQILEDLGEQPGCDTPLAIAALAFAMCSLARADGTPFSELEKVLGIAHKEVADA